MNQIGFYWAQMKGEKEWTIIELRDDYRPGHPYWCLCGTECTYSEREIAQMVEERMYIGREPSK